LICDPAGLKDNLNILVESVEPLAHIVSDNGVLDFHHDDDYIHEIQGAVIYRTFVIQFLGQLHLAVPCINIKAREDDGTKKTA